MIGGLLTIFVACWIYQGAISVNRNNVLRWVVLGTTTFYAMQWAFMILEIYFFVGDYDMDTTNTMAGRLQATYRELMPCLVAFLVTAFYRTKFVMQQKLSMGNLFSNLNIFKGSLQQSKDTNAKN